MKKTLPLILVSVIAAVLAAVLVVSLFVPMLSRRAQIREQFRIAAEYIAEAEYDSARLAFERVLEIDPKNAEAHLKLVDLHLAKEDPASALAVLEDALEQISLPKLAMTLIRVVDELIVGADILTVFEETGILDELPVEEILSALMEIDGEQE